MPVGPKFSLKGNTGLGKGIAFGLEGVQTEDSHALQLGIVLQWWDHAADRK